MVATAVDKIHVTATESKEKLSNMFSDYSSNESEIESLNSELEETKSKINELQAKGHLSLVEQEDLSKLQSQNQELERTLSLKKAQQKIDAKGLATQADETFEKYTHDQTMDNQSYKDVSFDKNKIKNKEKEYSKDSQTRINTKLGKTLVDNIWDADSTEIDADQLLDLSFKDNDINSMVAAYKAIENEQDRVKENLDDIAKKGSNASEQELTDAKELQKYNTELDQKLVDVQSDMTDYASGMQEAYNSYQEAFDEGVITKQQLQNMQSIKEFLQEYSKIIGDSASSTEDAITNIFAKKQFEGVEDSLVKAGKKGETAVQNMIKSTPGLEKALDDADISVQDLSDHIMAIADPDSLNAKEIRKQLKEAFIDDKYDLNFQMGESADRTWENFIRDKSDEEIEIMYRYVNNNNIDLADKTGDDLDYIFKQATDAQEVTDKASNTFSSLMKDSEGNETELSKSASSFKSDMDSIGTALDSLNEHSLDKSGINDLLTEFPDLASQTDNLQAALTKLSLDKIIEFGKTWKESTKDLKGTELQKANNYFASMLDGFDLSNVDLKTMRNKIAELISSTSRGSELATEKRKSDILSEFGKELQSEDGVSILLKVLADPSNADATIEELRKKYEDKKIDLKFEASNKELDKLHNQLNNLESSATKVQTKMNLNDARGLKHTVEDYSDLIENSNAQIANLQRTNRELQWQQTQVGETSAQYAELQSQIDANVNAIDQARINQLGWTQAAKELSYQPNEGLTAYNKAKETRNAGDNYLDMLNAAKEAQSAREEGLVGTDDFKTVAKMFSPNGMDDYVNWDENYGKVQRYFTEDKSGVLNFLNDLTIKTNDEGEALATLNEATGEWSYNIDDVQGSADQLGISFEAFLALMGRLQDYGLSNDFFSSVEEGQTHLGNLYSDLSDAELKLQQLEEDRKNGDATVTDNVLAEQEAKVNSIKQSIIETQDLLNQLQTKSTEQMQQEYANNMRNAASQIQAIRRMDDAQAQQVYLRQLKEKMESQNLDTSKLFHYNSDGTLSVLQNELQAIIDKYGTIDPDFDTTHADQEIADISNKLKEGLSDDQSGLQSYVDTLSQYSQSELSQITFGDHKYQEGFENAEAAIDGIVAKLGLSEDESQAVVAALSQLGLLKIEPEVSEDDVKASADEVQQELNSNPVKSEIFMQVDDTDAYQKIQVAQNLLSTINGENSIATVSVESSVAQTELDNIVTELSQLDQNKLIEIGFKPSQGNTITAEDIRAQIGTVEIPVSYSAPTTTSTGKVDSSSVDNYTPDSKTIKVKTGSVNDASVKGYQPESKVVPVRTGALNTSSLNVSLPPIYQDIITRKIPGGGTASGTLMTNGKSAPIVHAHTNGTDVALKHNETALVNELGNEALIRDGKLYEIPGGTHTQSLKKGDVVINADQWAEIKKYGSANGFAGKAYAAGTIGKPLMSAHADNRGSFATSVSSNSGSSNNSGSSGNVNSSGNNNTSKKKKSSSLSDKVSKKIEQISKWVSHHFDWIEVKIDHLQKKADSYYTKAQNAIDQGLNRPNNYKTAESNIKNSIATNERLITANQQGSTRYMKQANTVKKKYDGKLKKSDKKNFDAAVKTLNKGGKIDINAYSANVKQALEDYKKYYDAAQECKYAVDDLNSTLIEQKQALFNLPIDQATAKVNKLEVALAKLQLRFAKKSAGKNTSIKTQNKELDVELKNQKSQLNAQKNALDKTKANLTSAKKDQKSAQKSITTNKRSLVKDQKAKKTADSKVRSSSSALLKDAKISKTLTKKQKADLKKGKSISLSKSQKRKLSKSQQSKISDYNKNVKSSNKITSKISTDKQNISKAQKSVNSKNQTFQLAQDAYDTQLKTTNEAEKDYLEQIVANEKQKFDNVVSYFEKRTNLIEKQNSRKTAIGAYESANDYNTLISQTTQEITEMNKQLNSSVKKGKIQVGSDEWYEMKSQIVETETELANLNESARKIRLQEMFERAAESVQKFIDKLQTVNSLITDDMKFDKDGKLTQNGALSMMLDSKSLDESKENLKTYTKEREKILTTEWESKGYLGSYVRGVDSELDGLLDDIDSNIKSEVGNIQNYMQSLLNTVISANEKERDAILEVVDAHKEALSQKKDYYDYDKKMKNQNKTISELERQAAGLRGSTDKADKAQLQKIEAQLKDAKDERDDMVKDHLYEMQTDALDQISDDINKYYKEMIDVLKNSPTEAANAITKFMSDNDITGAKLAEQISSVLKQYIDPNNKDSKGAEEEIKNSGLTGTLPSQLPENSKTLTDAFQDLVSKINANGYGTAATTKQINDAQAAYNKLSSTEKSYVSADYKKFADAKTANQQESDRIAKAAADKKKQQEDEAAKLKAFQKAVKGLGSDYWTGAMTDRIKTAEAAYKKLTDAQKKTVKSQYETLVATKKKNSNQGNNKIDVGDRVSSMQSDWVYKYSNQPLSKNKKLGSLKRNAPYFVGEYKKNDAFPIHLYSDAARKHSVGWVRKDNLRGYASGTSSVKGDQLAWVNENWNKNGGEIIYRKSDGAMLMPLGNGDTVFSADKVQALYKMLETNPLPMNMGNVFSPRDLTTQVQTVNNTPVNYSDSHDIIVQGDLTRDTLPNLQEILKKSSEYTQNEIRKDLVKAGRKKTFH